MATQSVERRSADYKPNIWNFNLLLCLGSQSDEQEHKRQAQKLKERVKHIFVETIDPLAKLELVDHIERLGLASYFLVEIERVLDSTFESLINKKNEHRIKEDVYATSLCFRLLRLHGFHVSQDMFMGFMDNLAESKDLNVKAMLGLFEASHLAREGEDTLEDAKAFAANYLKSILPQLDDKLAAEVTQALQFPMNLRVEWYNVRNRIHDYEKDGHTNSSLLKLAKLNFNVVQAKHQSGLKDILRWWKDLGVMKSLSFTRNRIVESYLWAVGVAFEPQYGNLRKWLTKVIKFVLIVDDVYDIFGSLEELEIFTSAVERWDFEGTQSLPDSIKLCMKTLYDTVDEIAHEIQKQNGWDSVLHHLQNEWKDFCKALLEEARWFTNGDIPSLDEYLDNAWVTSSGPLIALHIVFSVSHGPQEEAIHFLKNNQDLVYNTSMIIRLCNDQATSKAEVERGDAPSSVLCYMREANISEEAAQEHIKSIIDDTWKKINNGISPSPFIKYITNMARVAHFIYKERDGFGVQDHETRDHVLALLIKPLAVDQPVDGS